MVPDLLEAYSSEAGIRVSDDENQTADFNKQAIDEAKQLLQERIRHTSKKVLAEIEFCPLAEENIIIKAGDPVEQIVKTAKEGDFDLVIMGTHGQGELEEIILGRDRKSVV